MRNLYIHNFALVAIQIEPIFAFLAKFFLEVVLTVLNLLCLFYFLAFILFF